MTTTMVPGKCNLLHGSTITSLSMSRVQVTDIRFVALHSVFSDADRHVRYLLRLTASVEYVTFWSQSRPIKHLTAANRKQAIAQSMYLLCVYIDRIFPAPPMTPTSIMC